MAEPPEQGPSFIKRWSALLIGLNLGIASFAALLGLLTLLPPARVHIAVDGLIWPLLLGGAIVLAIAMARFVFRWSLPHIGDLGDTSCIALFIVLLAVTFSWTLLNINVVVNTP
jgi:hypothetical protein